MATVRRCWSLLSAKERKRWIALLPVTLAAAAVEGVGTALIFALLQRAGASEEVVRFGAAVAGFYVLKTALLLLEVNLTNGRASAAVVEVSTRLLRGYLGAPYALHLRRNSAELMRNINGAADLAVRGTLVPAVTIATDALLVLAIACVLIAASPAVTLLAVALTAAPAAALLHLTNRRFHAIGRNVHEINGEIIALLQETFAGAKDIRVLGRERWFAEGYERLRAALSREVWRRSNLEALPRLSIETLFVLAVVGVIVGSAWTGRGGSLLPSLGLLAYAAFRVLPSLQRVAAQVNTIRFAAASVEAIAADWALVVAHEALPEPRAPMPFLERVVFSGVSFTHAGAAAPSLSGVDLELRRGEVLGIVGATGAGKSTLVDLLLGLHAPTAGVIAADGRDVTEDLVAWRRNFGFVPQSVFLLDDTLARNIAFGVPPSEISPSRLAQAVAAARLEPVVAALPAGLETPVGERGSRLSGGERQRVAIARALYHDPAIVVFDEATSQLDAGTEAEVVRAIEALRGVKTVVIVAHRLAAVAGADRVVLLSGGRVVDVAPLRELSLRHAGLA